METFDDSASSDLIPPQNSNITQILDSSPLPITHKLNGHKYLPWSQFVLMYVSEREKDDYLTGNVSQSKESNPLYHQWKSENHMVMSWLINSMLSEVGENFLHYQIARNATRDTCSCYENTSKPFETEAKLFERKQNREPQTSPSNPRGLL